MIKRTATGAAEAFLRGNFVLSIIGPRQSGKTTLARCLAPSKPYLSLEDPDLRQRALFDPKGFLAELSQGAILDEIQRCPELLSYLQTRVDADQICGEWIITGSNQFSLHQSLAQSLAGRVGRLSLLPLTCQEIQSQGALAKTWEEAAFRSGFPPLHTRELQVSAWLADYVATYVERDVRLAYSIANLSAFQRFLGLCAGRTAQLLNLAALAADAGIDQRTARTWLSILETSHLVTILPPFFRNQNKRLVKTPKLFFNDAGLATWLLGVRAAEQLTNHPLRGALFETFVVSEFIKHGLNSGNPPPLSFYRTRDGHEVDLLLETPQGIQAIEIKSSTTVVPEFLDGLIALRKDLGSTLTHCHLVHGGRQRERWSQAEIVPWTDTSVVAAAAASPG